MRPKSGPVKEPATQVLKNIRRATRRRFSAEDKIRIVLEGLRGEDSVAELCRREGIVQNLYYRWSKDFLEAGKKRLAGGYRPGGDVGRSEGLASRSWRMFANASSTWRWTSPRCHHENWPPRPRLDSNQRLRALRRAGRGDRHLRAGEAQQ